MGKRVALMAQMACLWEVGVLKPGNVSVEYGFSNLQYDDFLLSAIAVGSAFEKASRYGVGQTVLHALQATHRYVSTNTNLGIVLMLAPLVKACSLNPGAQLVVSPRFDRIDRLREDLSMVLATLTVEDAEASYQAIRLSGAGGMGKAPQADISEKPTITLLKAMALAQDRDSIAREYVSRYAITFEIGYPALEEAFGAVGRLAPAIVQSFLTVLSQAPDTLIARKCGREKAEEVSRWAGDALRAGGVYSEQGRAAIVDFDRALRDETHTLNPGTTADLISAAIFLHLYCRNRQGAYV